MTTDINLMPIIGGNYNANTTIGGSVGNCKDDHRSCFIWKVLAEALGWEIEIENTICGTRWVLWVKCLTLSTKESTSLVKDQFMT